MKKLEATSKKKPCYDPRQFLTVQKERDELKQTVREIELQLMQVIIKTTPPVLLTGPHYRYKKMPGV